MIISVAIKLLILNPNLLHQIQAKFFAPKEVTNLLHSSGYPHCHTPECCKILWSRNSHLLPGFYSLWMRLPSSRYQYEQFNLGALYFIRHKVMNKEMHLKQTVNGHKFRQTQKSEHQKQAYSPCPYHWFGKSNKIKGKNFLCIKPCFKFE